MKTSFYFLSLALLCSFWSGSACGQANLVVTTPVTATPGAFNTILGLSSGGSLTAASNRNLFAGFAAGQNSTSAARNVFLGIDAGQTNTTGGDNVFVGYRAGLKNTSAAFNVFVGTDAGQANTTGAKNVFIGYQAGLNNTFGSNNTFAGFDAGNNNTTGLQNTYFGKKAGFQNSTSPANSFYGSESGANNTGRTNSFFGNVSGFSNTVGNSNCFFGNNTGLNNTTGDKNTFFGSYSGQTNITGAFNTVLGADANVGSAALTYATAVGVNARVSVSNAIVLGDPDDLTLKVGIGTDSPQFPLDVRGTINLRGGTLKFAHLANPAYRPGGTDQFLTLDERGEMVLARHRFHISQPSDWADRVFRPGYALRPLVEVARFVRKNQHLPGLPSAEQVATEGIDATALNVTLLEKVEELTLYLIAQEQRINALQRELKTAWRHSR